MTTTTIPALLIKHYGNMSAVARELGCIRQTVATYARDTQAVGHVVHNGILMTASKKQYKFHEQQSPSKTQELRDGMIGKTFINGGWLVTVTGIRKDGKGHTVMYRGAEFRSSSSPLKKFLKSFKEVME